MKTFICMLAMATVAACSALAADPDSPAPDLAALKALIVQQQQQIDQLRQTLEEQSVLLKTLAARGSQPPAESSAAAKPDTSATSAFSGGVGEIASTTPVLPPLPVATAIASPLPVPQAAKPAADVPATQLSDSIQFAQGKFRIGALLYADWADYFKSGFGPQFLTQINPAGAGNNGFNTFEINRTYLNMYFSPNDNLTFRLTPNIYRQIVNGTADKVGAVSGVGASANENLAFRLKYAYVDIKNLFKNSTMAKGVTLSLGQQQNPLVDWEENLWSYRYVTLTPWNYLSLSSTQTGITLHGPLQSNGKTYLDFNAGIFTQASFHALEQAESKQLMARVTVYPFGSATAYQGLGITGFYDHAYSNVAPDTRSIPIYRGVAMVHYATRNNSSNIAFEYDFGRNAFSSGNMFSGSGPLDQFGLGTTMYAGMDSVIKAIQGTDRTKQRGYNVFGHLQLGKSPFQLLGWFETFQPNTEARKNPADFRKIVAGVQYRANRNLRFTFDTQDLLFTHGQFTMPASDISYFSGSLANANPNGIPNVVPPDIRSFFINMEFSF